jgi:hypothetical protein
MMFLIQQIRPHWGVVSDKGMAHVFIHADRDYAYTFKSLCGLAHSMEWPKEPSDRGRCKKCLDAYDKSTGKD